MNRFPLHDNRFWKTDGLLLVVLTLLVYARICGHEFQMSWDDNWYVVFNESIRGFSRENLQTIFTSIYQANYAPLQMLSYMLDYSVWGLDATGFLATNIVFHSLNGLLLYRMLYSMHGERIIAMVGAAIYLVHPLQVESVAWISCRKNVLSLFLFLVAWEFYRRYREAEPGKGWGAYSVSLAAFVLSLMAKSTTLVLPLVLVLYDYCFLPGDRRLWLKDKLPYLTAAMLFALVSMHVQSSDFQGGIRIPYHGGSPLATFYTMAPVLCRYIGLLIWPAGLSAIYAPPVYSSLDVSVVTAALFLTGVVWGGIRLFKADRKSGFWFVFFWIGLLPYIQIVPIKWLMFDRYLNVSIIGAAALAGAGAGYLHGVVREKDGFLVKMALISWVLVLAIASFLRAGVWKDSLTLWTDAAAKTPESAFVWEHLGETYSAMGNMPAARQAYERGIARDPLNTEILAGLGDLYTRSGELDKGMTLLKNLLLLKPGYVSGWAVLGDNYLNRGAYGEAERSYKRAYSLQPEAVQVVSRLGNLAMIQGRFSTATSYYRLADSKTGDDPDIAYGIACAEAGAGRNSEALVWLEHAFLRGFTNFQQVIDDRRLSAIKVDPRFSTLMNTYFPVNK